MGLQYEQAQRLGMVFVEDVADGKDVPERLGHFLAVDLDETVVQPVPGEGQAGSAFGLGNLVFVVGEYQVLTSPVDIESGAEEVHAHHGALDVPAGPAFAPGAVPPGLVFLARLPQG